MRALYEGLSPTCSSYKNVVKIDDSYKTDYKYIFFSYYSGDRKVMNNFGMESKES